MLAYAVIPSINTMLYTEYAVRLVFNSLSSQAVHTTITILAAVSE